MALRIIRPERKVYHIPGLGIETREVLGGGATNWWEVAGKTCVAAYLPKGAVSYAASLVNLANPGTYDATEGVAPSWDAATGWTFDGATQYLDTGIVPVDVDVWSMFVRFVASDMTSVYRALIGQDYKTNTRFYLRPINAPPVFENTVVYGAGGYTVVSPVMSSGVMGIAGRQGYRDGVADGAMTAPSAGGAVGSLYIGAQNQLGTNFYVFAGDIIAIAIYLDTLTGGEAEIVSARMTAL